MIKTISYRGFSTSASCAVVLAFTGEWALALAFGGIDVVMKMAMFFVHERAWNRIHFGRYQVKPFVLWFTGLSGSGKSTLSEKVYLELKKKGLRVEHLDGDKVRDLFPGTGFTREERLEHLRRVGLLTSYLERNGVAVVASFISPYAEARKLIRGLCQNYVEVYVSTPLEECERRDVKGLYSRARRGEIRDFTGIDQPYEKPESPEIEIDTSGQSVDESVRRIMDHLKRYTD